MRTLFAARLDRHASDASAPPAILLPGAEISYAELLRRVEHCAAWLRAEGLRAGDVAAITIADEVAHLTVSLALLVLGVPQICLPTFEPPAVRRRLAAALDVTRVVAVDPQHALPGVAASFTTPAFLAAPRAVPLQEALCADPGTIVLFVASSGSTGDPKRIAYRAEVLERRHRLRGIAPDVRQLILTTVEDIFGKSNRLQVAWLGGTSLFRASADAPLGAFCTAHRVTRLSTSVLQASGLAVDAGPLPDGLAVFTAGARVPMRLREAFRARRDAGLHVEYGTREVGLIASTWPDDRDPDAENVGALAPQVECEIVDADGRPLPPGEIGEVRLRTPYMVDGYYRDPSATRRNFRDGWFHPGDLGSFTPRGSLCLHGRLDDVMNLNGIKIYPSEIERALEDDPAVRAVAAFALPSSMHGEIPVAAVEWQGEARPDAAAMLARVRARLGVRAPRRILVVDALPRTSTGKVARRELADLVKDAR